MCVCSVHAGGDNHSDEQVCSEQTFIDSNATLDEALQVLLDGHHSGGAAAMCWGLKAWP